MQLLQTLKTARRIVDKRRMKPTFLIFNVTNKCQSKCITCFAWDYLNKDTDKELKIDEIAKLASNFGHLQWLLLTGGEPFLRPNIDEIIEIFYKKNHARRVTIPTNGIVAKHVIDSVHKIFDKCPDLNLNISLSCDGIGEMHDNIRGFKNNFILLSETYRQLAELKKQYPKLSLNMNTCLNNVNIKQIDEILDYVPKHFPDLDFHGFEILRGVSRAKEMHVETPPIAEAEEALKKIHKYWEKYEFYRMNKGKIVRAAKILSRDIEFDILKNQKRTQKCFAGSVSGVVYATGDIAVCELIPPLGNIRDVNFDLDKIWFGEKANKVRKSIKELSGSCQTCTHSCFMISSIFYDPMLYPKLFMYLFRS